MAFSLNPKFESGSSLLGNIHNCQIRLKNNACFPWLLIIPEVEPDIEDLHQLPEAEFRKVTNLIRSVSKFASDHFQPEKLNVACIGNQVRQMHIHVVCRSENDPAWPGTVWASDAKKAWPEEEIKTIRQAIREALLLK